MTPWKGSTNINPNTIQSIFKAPSKPKPKPQPRWDDETEAEPIAYSPLTYKGNNNRAPASVSGILINFYFKICFLIDYYIIEMLLSVSSQIKGNKKNILETPEHTFLTGTNCLRFTVRFICNIL